MEFGGCRDGVAIAMQMAASACEGFIEILDSIEVFVDEGLIDERPKMLGRLELGTVGGQEDQPDSIGNRQVLGTVPARVVENQNDDAVASRARLSGEDFEQLDKERFIDSVGQEPEGLSAYRCHEAGDIEPFVTVMAKRDGTFPDGRPDAAMDRF